ncbi:hypothetical protein P4S72_17730 [Vibrio sp. PP-XX7]
MQDIHAQNDGVVAVDSAGHLKVDFDNLGSPSQIVKKYTQLVVSNGDLVFEGYHCSGKKLAIWSDCNWFTG